MILFSVQPRIQELHGVSAAGSSAASLAPLWFYLWTRENSLGSPRGLFIWMKAHGPEGRRDYAYILPQRSSVGGTNSNLTSRTPSRRKRKTFASEDVESVPCCSFPIQPISFDPPGWETRAEVNPLNQNVPRCKANCLFCPIPSQMLTARLAGKAFGNLLWLFIFFPGLTEFRRNKDNSLSPVLRNPVLSPEKHRGQTADLSVTPVTKGSRGAWRTWRQGL